MSIDLKKALSGPKVENALLTASGLWNTPLSLWGLSLVDIPDGAQILDVGCSGGKNLERLLKKAADSEVSGIDESFRAVDHAYRLNEEAIKEGRCHVYEGSADLLPFGKEKFDLVIVEDAFFFWKEPEACLAEISRVLKPEGKLLLLLSKGGLPPLDRLYAALIPGMNGCSAEDIKDLLEEAGFRDVEMLSRFGGLAVTSVKPVSLVTSAKRKLNLPETLPYGKMAGAAALGFAALGIALAMSRKKS
ncbi:class I SAM-dependent methyltransferase [Dialister sp.]|uniref:class I SAM-dependent methyltransferase n=1 Tax=Dialister sp. TaxID=1955814 RepID=UPI002E815155|nr:class I SAM-dependent methyltransferase [Dialister sp.]MEE3452735.1 class I SAM-dependent methyltransferase [Dialister sp.]